MLYRSISSSARTVLAKQLHNPTAVAPAFCTQRRWLNLHEYQSKQILENFGLNVQRGHVASTAEEAFEVANKLKSAGATDLILKSQVLAGGRGKGTLSSGLQGGVKICDTPKEVSDFAKQMIGYQLVTKQTTEAGEKVNKVLVHAGVNIQKELYLAIVLDRSFGGPVVVASKMGGMDIEEVAESHPNEVAKVPINISTGVTSENAIAVAKALGYDSGEDKAKASLVADQVVKLYELFVKSDAVQVEINPLAIVDLPPGNAATTNEAPVVCVDAKISFDDNAFYRQKELFAMEDESTKDSRELAAEKVGLNFVGMDGNIGCLVNGAGLAMATMDIIKLYGGSPANFLDVGGGADVNQVTQAFEILQNDANVRGIFVNIFGGIMRCDIIAQGLVEAAQKVNLSIPLVVRLVGNNVELGKDILLKSPVKAQVIDDFDEAAKKACTYVV